MKKFFLLFWTVTLFTVTLGLVACGDGNTSTSSTDSSTTPTKTEPSAADSSSVPESTTSPETSAPETSVPETSAPETTLAVYDRYDPATYAAYIWEGNVVYNESIMFVGAEDEGRLLYTPTEILSVRSSDLRTEYQEGVDYVVQDGKILRTSDSSIPYMAVDEYYPATPIPNGSFSSRIPNHPNIRWGEGDTFTRYQLAVTYRHEDSWSGYVPEGQNEKLPKTIAKLQSGEATKILFFGDSITEGYNTSKFIRKAPYADTWAVLATKAIADYFHNDNVTCVNTAVAGKDCAWALSTYKENVVAHNPDLVVLAFGMNEGSLTPKQHVNSMKTLIRQIKKALPEAEIVVVSTMLPNEEAAGFWGNQSGFENEYLSSLVSAYPQVPVVRMTTLHKELLTKKSYYDLTGNNINHPNDFLARFYAGALIATLTGGSDAE